MLVFDHDHDHDYSSFLLLTLIPSVVIVLLSVFAVLGVLRERLFLDARCWVLAGLLGVSQPISASDGKLVNLSTRALVETGEAAMIGGFIIEDGARRVLIQAKGPELVNEGISNALADPVLTVIQTSEGEPPRSMLDPPVEIMVNDNWEDSQGQLVSDHLGRQSKPGGRQPEFGGRSHSRSRGIYRQG